VKARFEKEDWLSVAQNATAKGRLLKIVLNVTERALVNVNPAPVRVRNDGGMNALSTVYMH
jgi:hypothetical protein